MASVLVKAIKARYYFREIDMCFSTVLPALVVAATGAAATSNFSTASIASAGSLTAKNYYGAPTPHGRRVTALAGTTAKDPRPKASLASWTTDELRYYSPWGYQCPSLPPPPPPSPPHTSPPSSQLTYGLVDTVEYCEAMCDSGAGCVFINTYHDVNGKNGSPQLTCALFSKCLTAASADNCGEQSQPDGSIDYITNSNGYCKKY
ncbi:hypothetical protein B0H14DRAFT_3486029 [Mycena olivaceomarginata]|nr:hypothetical protein B0H14DRAFT_3486029 [Mycena olivaceomarginata]